MNIEAQDKEFTRDERSGLFLGRRFTQDGAAFTFRMSTSFPGSITRKHPVTVEPCWPDQTNPPTFFGQGVIVDDTSANGVRVPASGDSGVTSIYGITVRPFPFQQATTTNYGQIAFGAAAVPSTQALDILRAGYIAVTAQGAAPTYKGAPVHLNIVAGTGYVVGGFSADTVSGTFVTLADALWNGPAGSDGVAELAFNI